MKRRSSLRLKDWPMFWVMASRSLRRARAGLHGLHDVLISGATADVAFEPVTDRVLARLRIVLQKIGGAHDHSGRAEAALKPVALTKCFLHRSELAVFLEAFDGLYA